MKYPKTCHREAFFMHLKCNKKLEKEQIRSKANKDKRSKKLRAKSCLQSNPNSV